jgi:hypothetical protein
MATNTYVELAPPGADETVYDGVMRTLRTVFEPWERNPHMLQAYYRARRGPGGERLDLQGFQAIGTIGLDMLAGADTRYTHDFGLIIGNMIHAALSRFAAGDLAVTDILPALERTVHRLTTDNSADAAVALERRAQALDDKRRGR